MNVSNRITIAMVVISIVLFFAGAWPLSSLAIGVGIVSEAWRGDAARAVWYGFIRNPKYVAFTPIITTILLEAANMFQLFEMWSTNTADGQSPLGWICINIALFLWLNFYQVRTPGEKWAIRASVVGIAINAAVIATTLILK